MSTIISNSTVVSPPNNENMVFKGKHRLAEDVNRKIFPFFFFIECNQLG
jgi:hypothetical protein